MWCPRVAAITGLVLIATACGGGGAGGTTAKPGIGGTRIWAFSDANFVQTPSV